MPDRCSRWRIAASRSICFKAQRMRFHRHLLPTALLILALSACATSPKATSSMSGGETAAGLPDDFAGAWFVTAVFPTGAAHSNSGDRHLGVAVLVKGDEVSDVNGHRCESPAFTASHVTAEVAGLKMTAPAEIDRLQIACAGKPFTTLLQVPGKSLSAIGVSARNTTASGSALLDGAAPVLIAQRPEGLYLLERAEQVLYRQADMAPALILDSPARSKMQTSAPSKPKPLQAKPLAKAQPAKAQPLKTQPVATMVAPKPVAPTTHVAESKINKNEAGKTAATNSVTKTAALKPVLKPQPTTPIVSSSKATPQTQPALPSKNMMALMESDVSGMKPRKLSKTPATTTPTPASKAAVKTATAKPTAVAPKGGEAIHLASYPGLDAAEHGWASLRQQYSELASLKPLYVSTDGTSKAPTIRLFAAGATPGKLRQICSDLQSKQAYCTLNP
jgi:hypothetical protein